MRRMCYINEEISNVQEQRVIELKLTDTFDGGGETIRVEVLLSERPRVGVVE